VPGILVSELRENKRLKGGPLAGMERVAMGDPAHNARAHPSNKLSLGSGADAGGSVGAKRAKQARSCHSQCPSVEAQVDCLIDLATDPNVLARQWVGLATWV
jgi:hypothetical protein